jgi:ABC-type lipoprotein export system ATPase subunit
MPVLRDVTLNIRRGQTCAILGTSGSGKSTLLNILGLLDRPASGQFWFAGRDMIEATADVFMNAADNKFTGHALRNG